MTGDNIGNGKQRITVSYSLYKRDTLTSPIDVVCRWMRSRITSNIYILITLVYSHVVNEQLRRELQMRKVLFLEAR